MEKEYFDTTIRERNVITIPKEIMTILNAKIGDKLVFRPFGKQILVGLLRRDIIEKEINFEIRIKEK